MIEFNLTDNDFEDLRKTGFHFQMTFKDYNGRILLNIPHSHEFYEATYIINGHCKQIINNIPYECTDGDLTVLLPGDTHYFENKNINAAVMCLSISKSIVEQYFHISSIFKDALTSPDISRIVKLSSAQKSILISLCSSDFSIVNISPSQLERLKIILLNIIQFFSLNNLENNKNSQNGMKIARLNDALMQMTLPENIKGGMDALIRITNFSHSHLWRVFKENYDMTPHEYISKLRTQYAYELIALSDFSFEEIAEKVGYSSISHFNKVITKFYGKPPSVIRKNAYNSSHSSSKEPPTNH